MPARFGFPSHDDFDGLEYCPRHAPDRPFCKIERATGGEHVDGARALKDDTHCPRAYIDNTDRLLRAVGKPRIDGQPRIKFVGAEAVDAPFGLADLSRKRMTDDRRQHSRIAPAQRVEGGGEIAPVDIALRCQLPDHFELGIIDEILEVTALLEIVDLVRSRSGDTAPWAARSLVLPQQSIPVRLERGWVSHENLALELAGYRLASSGAVGLNQQLQVSLNVPLEKQAAGGRSVPVPLRGTITAPQPDVAAFLQAAGSQQLQKQLQNQVDKAINNQFKKLFGRE